MFYFVDTYVRLYPGSGLSVSSSKKPASWWHNKINPLFLYHIMEGKVCQRVVGCNMGKITSDLFRCPASCFLTL